MAKQKRDRRTWWPLYTLVLMMVGWLFLAHYLAPSPGWRTFLEVGGVIVGYGLMVGWLETHPNELLDRPAAEADSPIVESPERGAPSLLPAYVQYYFYVGAEPIIIYRLPDQPTRALRSNGHHKLAKTTPSLPEEAAG